MPQLTNKNPSDEGNVTTTVNSSGANLTVSGTIGGTVSGVVAGGSPWSVTGAQVQTTRVRQPERIAPNGWNKIEREFNPMTQTDDLYESPVNGKQVYIGSMTLSDSISRHHFALFTKLHPAVEYLLCGISQQEGTNGVTVSNIIFPNQCDFELFENWFAEYLELFGGRTALYSHMLPPPPTQMDYSYQVTLAKHESLLDACVWFRENCVANVYYLGNRLFFLNDEDAQLYRLKFC